GASSWCCRKPACAAVRPRPRQASAAVDRRHQMLTPAARRMQMPSNRAKPDAAARPEHLIRKKENDAPEMSQRPLPIILALGTTQTLAWASSMYLPAILADPIARDLGVSSNWIFAAFSASLVISALLGPRIGRQIDLVGGRSVLSLSNLVLAAGLALLGLTYSIPVLLVAWLLLGIGMGAGL